MLTQEHLKSKLHYDPDTGIFRWVNSEAHTKANGSVAGWHSGKGMLRISLNSKNYLLHRLAWFYVHGYWPKQIDHINGDRGDNRLANLREADNSQNQANQAAKPNNKLGIRGIHQRKGSFIVQLRKKDIKVRKVFRSLEEAKVFAMNTSLELHGEFSIHSRD